VYLTRAFAAESPKGKRQAGQRRVVNILDRRIASHEVGCAPYLLSKKMAAAFTLLAARELAPEVTVNAVAPGPVLPPPRLGRRPVHDRAGATPLRKRPTPEDVARTAAFLLESDAITGQIVFVDGGQHLAH
jgi:NAD(P)-dependent dehydrogenase (short-subunit alcohol dehydrogenase family)